jgi:glycosyltransferase involved in cell wall biosynthesis
VIHVAQLIPGLDRIGGAEQQAMLLSRLLSQRGWRVTVVALTGSGGRAAVELADAGIEFLSLRMRHGLADPRGWMRYHRFLSQSAPDLVHAHLPHAALLARCSRLATSTPVLIDTLHSSATGSILRRLAYRWTNFLPDRVTAVSEAVARAHLGANTVSRGKLVVLPNGIEPERWRPDAAIRSTARRELGVDGEFLWLAAGRLEPVKDYPTLLHAMHMLPDTAQLLIAGSGWQQAELTALSSRLGLAARVRFLGFVHDLQRWTQVADGFVLSSRWEGLPMALLEASAAGLPVVATDVPGVREALGPAAGDDRLVPSGIPAALARAMNALMETPAEARQLLGARARRFAVEQFSMQSVLDRWEILYRSLLKNCPATSLRTGGPADFSPEVERESSAGRPSAHA